MRPFPCVAVLLLCGLLSISSEKLCGKTQYSWPMDDGKFCCDKCPAGKRMVRRDDSSCHIECKSCEGNRFLAHHSVEMSCDVCKNCKKTNMVLLSTCNATHNAVCGCRAGYACKDEPCSLCVPLPTKPIPPTTPSMPTPGAVTSQPPFGQVGDTVWYLVIISLLCFGITLLVLTKIKPLLRRIRPKDALCPEDDNVRKPVQEVCGECDQPIDVCAKARQLLSQHLDK